MGHSPAWMVGCVGRISHTNFKILYGDFQDRHIEKLHRTTGPGSYLRPDLSSFANSGLETTFGIIETGKN
jgi:hypothetical protein